MHTYLLFYTHTISLYISTLPLYTTLKTPFIDSSRPITPTNPRAQSPSWPTTPTFAPPAPGPPIQSGKTGTKKGTNPPNLVSPLPDPAVSQCLIFSLCPRRCRLYPNHSLRPQYTRFKYRHSFENLVSILASQYLSVSNSPRRVSRKHPF